VESTDTLEARVLFESRVLRRSSGPTYPWEEEAVEQKLFQSHLQFVTVPSEETYTPQEWDHWELQQPATRYVTTRYYVGPSGVCYATHIEMQVVTLREALDWKYKIVVVRLYPEEAYNKHKAQEWIVEDNVFGRLSHWWGRLDLWQPQRRWTMAASEYHYHRLPPIAMMTMTGHGRFHAAPDLQPLCLMGANATPQRIAEGSTDELKARVELYRSKPGYEEVTWPREALVTRMEDEMFEAGNW